jgi:hypothetical protein
MSIAAYLFVWLLAAIGFSLGWGAPAKESRLLPRLVGGLLTSILFAILGIQIIK